MSSIGQSLPADVRSAFAVNVEHFIGGRENQHWRVETQTGIDVLRRYCSDQAASADFEHTLLSRLKSIGCRVGVALESFYDSNATRWTRFECLPGRSPASESTDDRRRRGRMLAELHQACARIEPLDQRVGSVRADEILNDPELFEALHAYEPLDPEGGHVLRWHAERAREIFASLPLDDAPLLPVHGDFVSWNLLFEDGQLTGIVDFESTHLDFRVADFALAWRGEQDEVIDGYLDVLPLSDLERRLITPVYWAWLMRGLKGQLLEVVRGEHKAGFEWQVKHLLRDQSRYRDVEPYRG